MSRALYKRRSDFLKLFKEVYDPIILRGAYRDILKSTEYIEPIKVQQEFIEAYVYHCTKIIKETDNEKIQYNINIIKQEEFKKWKIKI